MASTDSPLTVLLDAVAAKHRATSALTSAMKGPFLNSKPPDFNSDPNYTIMLSGVSVDKGWTCKRQYWLHEPEFRFYGKTARIANSNANLWLATFAVENLSLSLASGGLIQHRVTRFEMVELEPKSVEYASVTMKFRTWSPRSPIPG